MHGAGSRGASPLDAQVWTTAGSGSKPDSPTQTRVRPSARAFFDRRPAFGGPAFDSRLVPLGRPHHRLLDALAHPAQEAADMGGMIGHAEPLPDHRRDARGDPYLACTCPELSTNRARALSAGF